jgi:hypothetical protein
MNKAIEVITIKLGYGHEPTLGLSTRNHHAGKRPVASSCSVLFCSAIPFSLQL